MVTLATINQWHSDHTKDKVLFECKTCGKQEEFIRSDVQSTLNRENYPNLYYSYTAYCETCEDNTAHNLIHRVAIYENGKYWPYEEL